MARSFPAGQRNSRSRWVCPAASGHISISCPIRNWQTADKGEIEAMNRTVGRMIPNWVKSCTRGMILKCRQATWSDQCLPNFIIIGSQKFGTTSLYNYLSQHPQLVPSFRKEVHLFDGGLNPRADNFNKGKPWYCAYFPLRKNMRIEQQTLEASSLYIFNNLAPQRIAHLLQ